MLGTIDLGVIPFRTLAPPATPAPAAQSSCISALCAGPVVVYFAALVAARRDFTTDRTLDAGRMAKTGASGVSRELLAVAGGVMVCNLAWSVFQERVGSHPVRRPRPPRRRPAAHQA